MTEVEWADDYADRMQSAPDEEVPMEIHMRLEAPALVRGSLAVDAVELSELLRTAERSVDAHMLFLRDTEYPARFTTLGGGWTVTLRARRLGTTGMKRRYRDVDGEGPTPELAVANLTEGLDYLAEEMK